MGEDRFLAARISPGTMCTLTRDGILEWDAITILDKTTGKKYFGNCNDTTHPFDEVVRHMVRQIKHWESEVV